MTTIVNIGIGGSDLGPKMACQALGFYHHSDLNIYFVSNGDPTALHRLLPKLNPHTTLFILSSKSFQTKETQFNIEASFKWLSKRLPNLELSAHFVAVTAHLERVAQLPFKVRHTFMIEDWVGGRFSIWSSIGLPLAIMIGKAHFKAFLNGARNMDHHFRNTPFFNNMPVMMALMSVWYVSFKHMQHHAIIPYQHLLRSFPNYLQQLEMESNGKSLTFSNQVSALATCPVIWGGVGSNSQHAFHQYLHQGMHWGPIDFIMVAKSPTVQNEQYRYLLAQCVSQAEVLMKGHDEPGSHYLAGNRPSSMLILAELSPENLGALIALYEHKIYVQSALWNINAFDQPGVEQGKRNADENDARLIQGCADEFQDGSTQQLLNQLINWF